MSDLPYPPARTPSRWAGALFVAAALWITPLSDKYALTRWWATASFCIAVALLLACALASRSRSARIAALALLLLLYAVFVVKPLAAVALIYSISHGAVFALILAFLLNALLLSIPRTCRQTATVDIALLAAYSIFAASKLDEPVLLLSAVLLAVSVPFVLTRRWQAWSLPYRIALSTTLALAPLAFSSNSSTFYSIFREHIPTGADRLSPYVRHIDPEIERSVALERVSFAFVWPGRPDVIGVFEMGTLYVGRLTLFRRAGGRIEAKQMGSRVTFRDDCIFADYALVPAVDAIVRIDPGGDVLSEEAVLSPDVEVQALSCHRSSGAALLLTDKTGELFVYDACTSYPSLILFSPTALDRFLSNFHLIFLENSPISPSAQTAAFLPDGRIAAVVMLAPLVSRAILIDRDRRIVWHSKPLFGSPIVWPVVVDDRVIFYKNSTGQVFELNTTSWELELLPQRVKPRGGHYIAYDPVGRFLIIPFYDGRLAFVDPDSLETFEIARVGMRTHNFQLLPDERKLVVANLAGIFEVDLKQVDNIFERWKASRVQGPVHKR